MLACAKLAMCCCFQLWPLRPRMERFNCRKGSIRVRNRSMQRNASRSDRKSKTSRATRAFSAACLANSFSLWQWLSASAWSASGAPLESLACDSCLSFSSLDANRSTAFALLTFAAASTDLKHCDSKPLAASSWMIGFIASACPCHDFLGKSTGGVLSKTAGASTANRR